jgi:ribose-phosphate pyrophosphokinase
MDNLKVFSGCAHPALSRQIAEYLGLPLGKVAFERFPDGELLVKLDDDVRGRDVFILQPTCPPVNENLMALLIFIDCARRASAKRITAVMPYFGYARQDRKDQPRAPISAKLVANLITVAGADRALTMDLHSAQIQGFFDIPFDHLYAAPVLIEYFMEKKIPNLMVVAPDIGSVKMARAYAKRLEAELGLVDKRRPRPDSVEVMNIIGEVEGHNVVLFDDLVTTARTLCQAAETIRAHGGLDVYAGVTHGIFAPGALERLRRSPIKELVITDTICHPPESLTTHVRELSVAGLLGEAVERIHEERSLSSLFV